MPENLNNRVKFFFDEDSYYLRDRKKLKTFLLYLFKNERKKLEQLNYIFCSDKTILEINKKHLNHNFYTDVITFELSATSKEIVGEIYISIERVKENAILFNTPFKKELHRVMFHGALHLCGYFDKSFLQKKAMTRKEDFYLDFFFK